MRQSTIKAVRKAMSLCQPSKTKTKIIKKLWKIESHSKNLQPSTTSNDPK